MAGGASTASRRRLACCALWLVAAAGLAGINEWTPIGPPGGHVGIFAVDPRNPARLYAGTFDQSLQGDNTVGVFRSEDAGETWKFVEIGGIAITGLAVDSRDSSILYATSLFAGFLRSEDFGMTWTRTLSGGYEQPFSLTADPSQPGTLYASVSHFPLVGAGDSICRTSDGGRNWDRCFSFGNASRAGRVAIDPVVPSRLYAPVDGLIWTSQDTGLHWTPLTSLPIGGHGNIAVSSTLPPVVYTDGLIQSFDAGTTWFPLGAPPLGPGFILLDPFSDRTIYVAGLGGVSRSRDGGTTWSTVTHGFPSAQATLLVTAALDRDTLYAIGSGSVYRITVSEGGSPCIPDTKTMCLGDGRFAVAVSWRTAASQGQGTVLPLTQDAGAFWFFSENNLELVVKVVDGRFVNGRFWVFGAGLTDVAYELVITDMKTGATWTHHAETGRLESYADTLAF